MVLPSRAVESGAMMDMRTASDGRMAAVDALFGDQLHSLPSQHCNSSPPSGESRRHLRRSKTMSKEGEDHG